MEVTKMDGLAKVAFIEKTAAEDNDQLQKNLVNLKDYAQKRNQQVGGIVDEADDYQKKLFERSGINMPPKNNTTQSLPVNGNNNVTTLFNQRNRLKSGTDDIDQLLLGMENNLKEMEQQSDNRIKRIDSLLGTNGEPSEARKQLSSIFLRNRDESGELNQVKQGRENVERLKAEGQQLNQQFKRFEYDRFEPKKFIPEGMNEADIRFHTGEAKPNLAGLARKNPHLLALGGAGVGLGLAGTGAYLFNRNKDKAGE
jgi:hypothetical protein